MIVDRITDYLETYSPVSHLAPDFVSGAYLHYLADSNSAVLSIKEDHFTDEEMELFMRSPIEIGAYEKNNHLLLLAKIGPIENPFIYTIPFNPVAPISQPAIDRWVASRFIVVCLIEGTDNQYFRNIRLLGIPQTVMEYAANNWVECIKQGSGYALKYRNFLHSALANDPLELWEQSTYLGFLER